jgi:hypothetical protein
LYSEWRSTWLDAFIACEVLCWRITGNCELAGSWKRQTSATAKWVSIDFPSFVPGLSLMQRPLGSIGT